MKKSLCAALGVLLLILSGCGAAGSSPAEEPSPEKVSSAAATPEETGSNKATDASGKATDASVETTAASGESGVTLKAENFSEENGYKIYSENGSVRSSTGVDVSSYCGDIDWERVKNAGITFAMVRLGGRGYGAEGALYSDDRAAEYTQGAKAAGIKTGGYFFSQAVTPEEAREEAAYCKELLGSMTPDCPIAYDLEFIADDEARTDGLSVEQATACARAFCDEIISYGWTPMLYAGDAERAAKYDLTQLSGCAVWYTEYSETPNAPFPIKMWQYSKTASVDGIDGSADLDMMFF